MSSRLECEIESAPSGGPRVVIVKGEVDLSTAPELETYVRGALDGATNAVVLDLDALTFIDSSGLRVLVALSKEGRTNGTALQLRNVPRHAQRVLDITGLSDWFDTATE